MTVKQAPYDVGDLVTLALRFYDDADAPADPTDVTLELVCPDRTLRTYLLADLDRLGVGHYEADYLIANGAGRYRYRGIGTGALPVVQQGSFGVRRWT